VPTGKSGERQNGEIDHTRHTLYEELTSSSDAHNKLKTNRNTHCVQKPTNAKYEYTSILVAIEY
jgi:hypothetical protein